MTQRGITTLSGLSERNSLFHPVIPLLPNRVRRNYRGGYLLEKLEGNSDPQDGIRPEDWLASTVRALNPGMEIFPDEGLATVVLPDGFQSTLRDLIAKAPSYYLGQPHVEHFGLEPGFLAKILDSSMRLHVQAHPTTEFARKHLDSPWGKLEAYVILAVREEGEAYLRLGFQRPPSPEEWHRIVMAQDIAAMDACFDKIPIRVGEVWLVPGGLPHAIGEGVMMLEVMEPSDLVVRCEFEREGVLVPPEARFMQTDINLAMQIFDYTPLSVREVESRYRIKPEKISPQEELLIGPKQTNRFTITRQKIEKSHILSSSGQFRLGLVVGGKGNLIVEGQELTLRPGLRFALAAGISEVNLVPLGDRPLEILFCHPGRTA